MNTHESRPTTLKEVQDISKRQFELAFTKVQAFLRDNPDVWTSDLYEEFDTLVHSAERALTKLEALFAV